MNYASRYSLALLGLLTLVGGGCLAISGVNRPSTDIAVPSVNDSTPTVNDEVSNPSPSEELGWRGLLDMRNAKPRTLESGKTTISLPALFFEPNNANTDVPGVSYVLREEALLAFPASDTPWHTSVDISQEQNYIASGDTVPSIHSGAEKVVRYSKDGTQGYFVYDCRSVEGEHALMTIFTFFDETHRYRLELVETNAEWKNLDQAEFGKTCIARIDKIIGKNLEADSQVKYEVLDGIFETIRKI